MNSMLKNLLICFVLLFLSTNAYSRYYIPTKENAKAFVEKKVLLVLLKEYDQADQEKKQMTKEEYGKYVEDINTKVKYALTNYWALGHEIKFVFPTEYYALIKEKEKYAAIECDWRIKTVFHTLDGEYIAKKYSLFWINGYIDDKRVFAVRMPTDYLTQGEWIFITQQFNHYIEAGLKGLKPKDMFNVEQNLAELTKRTLIFPSEYLEENTTHNELFKKYEFPCEIKPLTAIDSVIKSKDNKYAYIVFTFSDLLGDYAYMAVENETGKTLSIVSLGGITVMFVAPPAGERNKLLGPQETFSLNLFRHTPKELKGAHISGLRMKFAQNLNNKKRYNY